jgi:FtsP/CotA-like multicopper oxidase with cupredoxin domain
VADAGDEHDAHGGHDHAPAGGIEWEDDMVEVNRMTTPANMRWKLIDRETEAENAAIDWRFRVGDQVKIRVGRWMAHCHIAEHHESGMMFSFDVE